MLQNPQDFIITGYYPPPYFYCSRTLPDEFGQIIKIEVNSNKREIESKVLKLCQIFWFSIFSVMTSLDH